MLKVISRIMLWLAGWKVDENFQKESSRSVMIAAPHTSNWDGIWVRVVFAILGIPAKIAVKDTMTKFPMGLITKPLGFLGIDRSKKDPSKPRKSQIEQMADFFKEFDQIAMVIAPEGTRSLSKEWKLGFYYVAKIAKVPITFGYLDFEKKLAGVGGVLYPTDNLEADMKKVMEFYKNISPKYPDKYSLDQRYV